MSAPADHAVLVVDDNDDIREMLVSRLEQEGFRATGVSSGPDALQRVSIAVPSLILLDISMPGMSGLEALATLRETHGPVQLPIDMVTEPPDSDGVVEAIGLGADGNVTKPVAPPVNLART